MGSIPIRLIQKLMAFYKNSKRPKLTLKERLIKNKQYLKRRLLRISKRANWLKRKFSKRLKHVIKPRRVYGFYNSVSVKKQWVCNQSKILKTKLKKNKIYNKKIKVQRNLPNKVNQFNAANVAKKILNEKTPATFKYFN